MWTLHLGSERKGFERQPKLFRQQRELFLKFSPQRTWTSSPPACLIYSACRRTKIRVSGRCHCLGAASRTLVIFCMSKAPWWDVWRPVWPTTRASYWDSPSPPHFPSDSNSWVTDEDRVRAQVMSPNSERRGFFRRSHFEYFLIGWGGNWSRFFFRILLHLDSICEKSYCATNRTGTTAWFLVCHWRHVMSNEMKKWD